MAAIIRPHVESYEESVSQALEINDEVRSFFDGTPAPQPTEL